jgi:hypothetical protein
MLRDISTNPNTPIADRQKGKQAAMRQTAPNESNLLWQWLSERNLGEIWSAIEAAGYDSLESLHY